MKSLDYRLSSMVSPFDDNDISQDELLATQHLQYQKESIIESIGTRRAKIECDLHLDEVIEQLQKGMEYSLFLKDCLKKLSDEYFLDVIYDYNERRGLTENNPDQVLELLKYFVYDKWLEDIALLLPEIDVKMLNNSENVFKLLSESYLDIQNKIIEREDINPLIHFYFKYCSEESGIRTLVKMVMSDLPGVISVQLVKKIG